MINTHRKENSRQAEKKPKQNLPSYWLTFFWTLFIVYDKGKAVHMWKKIILLDGISQDKCR